jgi:hypothetical protein
MGRFVRYHPLIVISTLNEHNERSIENAFRKRVQQFLLQGDSYFLERFRVIETSRYKNIYSLEINIEALLSSPPVCSFLCPVATCSATLRRKRACLMKTAFSST